MDKAVIKYLIALIITFALSIESRSNDNSSSFEERMDMSLQHEKSNIDSAIYYCKQALDFAKKNGNLDQIAESYYQLAHLQKNKGEYNLALKNGFDALKLFEENKDYPNIVKTLAIIGTCYSLTHNNVLAKEHFISAITIGKEKNCTQVSPLIGLGNTLYYQDSLNEAEQIYLQAIGLMEETGESSAELNAGIFVNLGNIKFMQNDFELANNFYQEGYSVYEKINNKQGMCLTSYNIGEVYYRLHDLLKAEFYLQKTLQLGKEIKSIDDIQYALQSLCDVYKDLGAFEKALEYNEKYHSFRDSIDKITHQQTIDELELKYKKEKNESKLQQQEKLIRSAKIEKIKDDQYSRFLLWGIFGISIIAILSMFSYLKIRKKNRIIEDSKKVIDKSLHEKDILLKEIHHRVKNNLQMISSLLNLQSYSLTNKDAIQALNQSKNRVQAIALVHKKLYQDTKISEIKLYDYVYDLSKWMSQFTEQDNKIIYNISTDDISLNIDTMVPLGLLISELITNSQKHAFDTVEQPEINIIITEKANNLYTLIYSDNGKGLPDEFSIENLNSLGFEIIESLTEQLNGSLKITSKSGILVQLDFQKI